MVQYSVGMALGYLAVLFVRITSLDDGTILNFKLALGNMAVIAFPLFLAYRGALSHRYSSLAFGAVSSVACANLVLLAIGPTCVQDCSWWNWLALVTLPWAVCFVFGSVLLVSAAKKISSDRTSRLALPPFITGLVLSFVAFRLSFLVLSHFGVSNEDRSLVLAGFEIHHIGPGLFGLYAVSLLALARPSLTESRVFATLAGIAVGMVADQSTYCMLMNMSDEKYGEMFSLLGGISVAALYVLIALLTHRRT